MKNLHHKISNIIFSIIILFSIWQTPLSLGNSIITPQPIFDTQQTSTQKQNRPSNKIIQKSQPQKTQKNKKTTPKPKKISVKKTTTSTKTTKPKTVNQSKNTTSKTVNSNSKSTLPKNWERYITPPIIIIALILVSITSKDRA